MSVEGAPHIKHDWYQTDQDVVINVLAKSLTAEAVNITIEALAVEVVQVVQE